MLKAKTRSQKSSTVIWWNGQEVNIYLNVPRRRRQKKNTRKLVKHISYLYFFFPSLDMDDHSPESKFD